MPESNQGEQSRRRFLKVATVAIGGIIGVVMAVPLVRYLFYPVGRRVVASADQPIDVGPSSAIVAGAPPVRAAIRASSVRDAWSVASDVPVGAAWISRTQAGQLIAFSSTCPHLGCAVDLTTDKQQFRCPCHTSSFDLEGHRQGGPAKRGLDPLEAADVDGRVMVTYRRFRADVAEREEV